MSEDFSKLNDEERLKVENEFLKMKLMLERGGQFGGNENKESPLSPEIENQFLNNIMAFEKQFDEHKTIKVFDKIGRPQHFKAVAEISDEEMPDAWRKLSDHLNEHGVELAVCSTNISVRELYRFTTEELFEHEMDDMELPGWTTNFIYDEFHPDLVYDNSRLVQQDLFHDIFRKEELFCEIHYAKDGFVFNDQQYDDYNTYREKINLFKTVFDEIELTESNVANCYVEENECLVTGDYKAIASSENNETVFEGDFRVKLVISALGYWDMKEIQINGFNP
ncbi:MAG TPA: hypothetical protein VFD56_01945 [Chitinophagaceae bacterium]|nr:hypothetical protein [Chitinophagaceae bacterium]